MADRETIDERHEKDRGYDPFKESENDDNRDVAEERKEEPEEKE